MIARREQIQRRRERCRALPDEPAELPAWIGADGPAPARCALDLALHDRIARRLGVPLYRLLDLPAPARLPTSFTIAIAEPEEMARLAAEASGYPILKIKLGSDDDAARLAAVRAARPDATLRVDANAGWSAQEAVARLETLAVYGLEMVEQPVAKHDIAGMGYVQARTELPIIADESVQSLADLEALAAAGVRGINLKLQKVGGLGPGVAMLRRAKSLGLKVMLGCMIETAIGVTAMAHLSGLADWLDLDAPLLISNDPFEGITFDQGALVALPERAGIRGGVGVVRVAYSVLPYRWCGPQRVDSPSIRNTGYGIHSTLHALGGLMMLWQLFWLFTRVALFSWGGGPASMALMQQMYRSRLGHARSVR